MILSLILISLFLNPEQESLIPRVGDEGVDPPIFTKRVPPQYPKGKVNLSSYLMIECICRKDGKITDFKVLTGMKNNKEWALAFIEAIKKWEFIPGKKNGIPSDVVMTLRIDF